MTNPYAPGKSDDHDNWRVKAEGSGEWFKGIRFQLIHVATERFLGSSAQLSHPSIPPGQQAVACVAQDTDETWWSAPSGEQPEAIQFSALKVDLGPSLAAVSFGTPAELLEWWRRERSFNAWLQTRSGPAARTVNEALHEIEDEVVRLNDVPVRRQSVIAWQNAGRKLAGAYQQRRLIHSSSPEGMLIAGRVAANRPEEAEGALEFFLGEAKGEAVGLVKALLFQAGVGDQDIHSNRLAELHANWDRRFAQSHQDAVDAEAAARERLASAEKNLATLENTYNAKLALEAPVQYWREKRNDHWWGAGIFGAVFLILAIVAVYGASKWLAPWLSADSLPHLTMTTTRASAATAPSASAEEKPYTPPAWKLAFLVVLALVIFWTLRIVSRLLLGNAHLAMDAASRSVMIQTYLAPSRRVQAREASKADGREPRRLRYCAAVRRQQQNKSV